MNEVSLPSGAILKIQVAPFGESKNLYQVFLDELKGLKVDPSAEIDVNLFKDLFCMALSSRKIESALEPCLKRCLYNESKIDKDTFEPVERRDDYLTVCFEVAKENILPFTKSLSQQYAHILEQGKKILIHA